MTYGYARVSSKDQKLDRQIVELIKFGVEKENIITDKQSGKDFIRENYLKLRNILKEGDLLVIKSIDRLGRNYNMILEEWAYITKVVNCNIVVLDMNLLDTRKDNNLIGQFLSDVVLQLLSFVAENERSNIKQRQAEGIKIAKAKGIKFGRPIVLLPKNFKEIVIDYKTKKICLNEALKRTNLTRSSFYKYMKNIK